MREGVLWTNLSLHELSRRLLAMGTPASRRTIRRLLRKLKLGRRTARKKKTMGHHPDRNAQFENIARLRREYEAAGDAVISIDTKNSPFALSILHILNFKLPVKISSQPQPLEDGFLHR
jgi:arginine repressor